MPKKIIHSSVRRFRFRYISLAFLLVVLSTGGTVYGLYVHQKASTQSQGPQKVAQPATAVTPQPTSAATPPSPTAAPKPSPIPPKNQAAQVTPAAPVVTTPVPVVTPAPSSQVSTLTSTPAPAATTTSSSTPTSGQKSSSTTSYKSTNWSGYMATSGSFTSVSGSWKATVATNTNTTSGSADGTWVGIGGVTASDLIQVGTENTISPSGVVSTAAFYELLPDYAHLLTGFIVTPGDSITASVAQGAANQWTISITDVTTAQSFSTTVTYVSSLSTAEWIQEVPSYANGTLMALDNFGTASFTGGATVVDGVSRSIAGANSSAITMINGAGASIAVPTTVTDGMFSVSYQ